MSQSLVQVVWDDITDTLMFIDPNSGQLLLELDPEVLQAFQRVLIREDDHA